MSITKQTHKFLAERPSIKDCIRRGLINYSALAREVCTELDIRQFDAVLVACRRYVARIEHQATHEKRILALLKRARIRTRNKMCVVILEKPRDFERLYILQKRIKHEGGDFNLIEGDEAIVLISNTDYLDEIRESFRGRIEKTSTNLVQISMIFDEKIETTPGVVSFIYGLLAEHSINVLEEMSCWTELMIMVSDDDCARTLRLLSF